MIAEHSQDLQKTITEKIEAMIRSCDIALLLLTEDGLKSNFVQQEIGYIKSINKPFQQLVQVGAERKITGFNFGRDFIGYDPKQPQLALEKIKKSLLAFWAKQIEAKKIEDEKKSNEEKIGLGILAGLIFLAVTSER